MNCSACFCITGITATLVSQRARTKHPSTLKTLNTFGKRRAVAQRPARCPCRSLRILFGIALYTLPYEPLWRVVQVRYLRDGFYVWGWNPFPPIGLLILLD